MEAAAALFTSSAAPAVATGANLGAAMTAVGEGAMLQSSVAGATLASTAAVAEPFSFGLREAFAAGSGLLKIVGGFRQSAALNSQANFEEYNARNEEIAGMQQANEARARMLKALAQQNAAFGASGSDIGSGDPVTVMDQVRADGERELNTIRDQSIMRAGGRRFQAGQLREQGTSAIVSGFGGAAGTLFDYVDRKNLIGSVPKRA